MKLALGVLGNATSLALFMSPLPTFWMIYKLKSTREYSVFPYLCTLFNCAVWLLYGSPYVKPHNLLLLTINGAGFILELFYLMSYLTFASKKNKVMIVQLTIAMSLILATVVVITILVIHTLANRQLLAGTLCVIFSIAMYASPFCVMREVIKTKSVECMPFLISLFNLLNALVWFAYSFVTKDIFIRVPNGIGFLCGIIQIILYYVYRNHEEIDDLEIGIKGHHAKPTNIVSIPIKEEETTNPKV
ncbi:hypothetical protein SUGI_0407280 [Cryptomeria japonica]|nr:hypothetical protein SUGI_0407280 [Cryptomeria japonica]